MDCWHSIGVGGGGGEGGQFLESLHATDSDRNTFWLNGPLF